MYKGNEMIILYPIQKTNSILCSRQQKLSKNKLMRVRFLFTCSTLHFQIPPTVTNFLSFLLVLDLKLDILLSVRYKVEAAVNSTEKSFKGRILNKIVLTVPTLEFYFRFSVKQLFRSFSFRAK
jgi:hypothetical protein